MAWWQTVTVTPEERRRRVLRRGISLGLRVEIPIGGIVEPSSRLGERDEWKKAQKKEIKRNNSDIMNKITPNLIPFLTRTVCNPRKEPSLTTSRDQRRKVERVRRKPKVKRVLPIK